MSDATISHIPAGWYPDPLGVSQRRWWDSRAWTQYVAPVQYRAAEPQTSLPATTDPVYVPMATRPREQFAFERTQQVSTTVAVWLITIMPAIQLTVVLMLIFMLADFGRFMQTGFGLIFFLWTAVLATRDRQALVEAGHTETASPCWLLLSPLAYLIARTIRVHQNTGRGFAPLWVYLVLAVLPVIAALVYLTSAGAMHLVLLAAAQ